MKVLQRTALQKEGATMRDECRVVSTFVSGWQRQGEWSDPGIARRIFDVAAKMASTDIVAIDLEKRAGRMVRTVMRYQREEDGSLARVDWAHMERLRRSRS